MNWNKIISAVTTIIFAIILLYTITFLTSGCCIAHDIKATIKQPKLESEVLYYPEIVEVYKPARNPVVLKSDSIREW